MEFSFKNFILFILALVIILQFIIYYITNFNESIEFTDAIKNHDHITYNNKTIAYQTNNIDSEVTLLLIHGTAAWSQIYSKAIATLPYKVYAIDMPPFGYSEKTFDSYSTIEQAKIINEFIKEKHLENVIIAGHSYGARATLDAVLSEQSNYIGMILIDPAIYPNIKNATKLQPDERTLYASKPFADLVSYIVVTNKYMTKPFINGLVFNKSSITPELINTLQQPFKIKGTNRAVSLWIQDFFNPDLEAKYTKLFSYTNLQVPTYFIWGSEDTVTPISDLNELSKIFVNSKVAIIKGSGHIPHIEKPNEFITILNESIIDIENQLTK